ncbi:MAG: DEAD/DEAH box helicase, partial [Lachnospiraceae bacterium]|nr:DEAD/DEAH box helicase [Lachnospiraceae bacterium]
KQVAMLVPTTILAQQHYNTFTDRFRNFPVNVEMLCRFRTKKEQDQIVKDLQKGAVDIVIGTHRLLSKDVRFKDLGLLIIDEEQRLGVAHKEKIKQLKEDVDVLTLTATPIPRTLHMGLSGIRDMSILEEPPEDRQPIQTYIMEFNEEIIREAIEREVKRGGQVYFVYNHIASIADMTSRISSLVPDVTVEYAHGRMSETRLEDIMYSFINREIDVLVSTTIIETGLDIPNVNTMIINDADKMGLAQLYQLRGRIGRSSRTAYAFLMYRRDKLIREVAEKRLKAIREFTDLGSGFKLAMRDLEIRGAGDLLGARQSGHMEAVGYDLYCRMLKDAVLTLKGDEPEDEGPETEIDVPVDAFIPGTYIRNEAKKLDMYKRISLIRTKEDFDEIYDEMTDRFGDVPKETENLMNVALLKELARSIHITSVRQNDRELILTMDRDADIDVNGIPELVNMYKGRLSFRNTDNPYFIYRPDDADRRDPLKCEFSVINNFKALLENRE